jgi:hypothetical protein
MEAIFREGDKVFCYYFGGWGEVFRKYDSDHTHFPLRCSFPIGNASFTEDGRYHEKGPIMLSFTEYTLEGFSQERPEELPKIGDIVWVREYGFVDWRVSHFFGKSGDKYLASIFGIKELAATWAEMTTKNPHVNEQ